MSWDFVRKIQQLASPFLPGSNLDQQGKILKQQSAVIASNRAKNASIGKGVQVLPSAAFDPSVLKDQRLGPVNIEKPTGPYTPNYIDPAQLRDLADQGIATQIGSNI